MIGTKKKSPRVIATGGCSGEVWYQGIPTKRQRAKASQKWYQR